VKSIRTYLLLRLLGGSAFVLSAAGVLVYFAVARSLEAQFDRALSNRIQGIASLLFQEKDHVEFEFSDQLMPEYEREVEPDYFELWFSDGKLLERSDSLRSSDLTVPVTVSSTPVHWAAALPDGRPGRFVAQSVEVHHVFPEEGPNRPIAATVVAVIGAGMEQLAAAERDVMFECALVALVLIGVIGVLSWSAVDRGLAPAKRLAATLDAIDVQHVPERLDVGEVPRELAPVAEKTNALIQRVDAALERERRTTADIAHELRTPISEVLTASEVALRDGRDPEGARRALATIRSVAWRMGRSVSTLLKLARLEMGAETFDRESVELGELTAELLRTLATLERERGLRIENSVGLAERVDGDREVLRIVVSNLLSNALYYTPAGGRVACRVERAGDSWTFTVENDAPDLTEADLSALADPFWRKDRARADRDRSGLGLALSCALSERAGMHLGFDLDRTDSGCVFRAALAGRGAVRRNGALGAEQRT
jgi:two-component system sensor histidine kinase QseC